MALALLIGTPLECPLLTVTCSLVSLSLQRKNHIVCETVHNTKNVNTKMWNIVLLIKSLTYLEDLPSPCRLPFLGSTVHKSLML